MVKAFCATCREIDYVDARYRCLWCGEVTLKARARPGQPHPGSISVRALREAHRLHAHGATLLEAATAVEHGYVSARILAQRLPAAFAGLGLPYRSIRDAQRVRYARTPQVVKYPHVTRETALAAVARHFTLQKAAESLGCSRKTVARRLA